MITALGAAQAIKYLHAAGAMNVVDDQEVVWADYLNSSQGGCGNAWDEDLLPAARCCIRRWNEAEADFRRKVNVDDFARYVRAAHSQKLDEICGLGARGVRVAPAFTVSDSGGYVPNRAWYDACHAIADEDKTLDKLTIWKAATKQVTQIWGVRLDPSAEQPDWVRQSFQIEAAA